VVIMIGNPISNTVPKTDVATGRVVGFASVAGAAHRADDGDPCCAVVGSGGHSLPGRSDSQARAVCRPRACRGPSARLAPDEPPCSSDIDAVDLTNRTHMSNAVLVVVHCLHTGDTKYQMAEFRTTPAQFTNHAKISRLRCDSRHTRSSRAAGSATAPTFQNHIVGIRRVGGGRF